MDIYQSKTDIKYHVLRAAINLFGKTPRQLEPAQLDKVCNHALKECVLEQQVLDSVEARDVHISESVLQNAVKQVVNNYSDRESYLIDLEDNNLSESQFHQSIERELRVNTVLDRVASRTAKVTEIDCMLFYYMHKDKFDQPETRTTRHILITINDDFAENTRQAASEKIKVIRRRVAEKTKRFAEQAMKHSECPTALQGGLLGKIPRGQLYPELDEKLFSMKSGEISEVIESELGLHILYCEHIHLAGPVPFKEAERRIRDKLTTSRMRMCQKSWLTALKQKAKQGEKVYE